MFTHFDCLRFIFQLICSAPMNNRLKFFVSFELFDLHWFCTRCPAGLSIDSKQHHHHQQKQQQKLQEQIKTNRNVKFFWCEFGTETKKFATFVYWFLREGLELCLYTCLCPLSIQLNMIFTMRSQIKMVNIYLIVRAYEIFNVCDYGLSPIVRL